MGICGRLSDEKRQEDFLVAARFVLRKCPHTKFIIIGHMGSRRISEKRYLYVKRLGIEKQVIFLGERSDVNRLMQVLDVHVLCSTKEGCPNVLIEAMAAGVPQVATNIAPIAELMHDGREGILTPVKRPKQLASAIVRLLTDPQKATLCRTNARKTAAGFSLPIMIHRYEHLFEELWNEYQQ